MASPVRTRRFARIGAIVAGTALAASAAFGSAQAAPLWPGGPDVSIPGMPGSSDPAAPAPQQLVPQLAPANFADPSISPSGGEVVGVAQPIAIRFDEAIGDRDAALRAIRVTTTPSVPGHFYWINDTQVRWLPNEFYPAHTQVTVEAGGAKAEFSTGDSIITTADDNTEYATRISYSGIFVHAAPWSESQQGYSNASHGCLNVSTEDGKWFFENVQKGDPVIVVNTDGGTLSGSDGLGDWNR